MVFIQRNLRKVQAGRGVNAPGIAEIPLVVFEELLVNTLVHRDYLISAPTRLYMFDDSIKIVSPGHVPDHLTVEHIRVGNSNIRNPILVYHVAEGLLPYRGLGSGVQRALEAWPQIGFVDDREGCLFTATIRRIIQPETRREAPIQSATQWTVFWRPCGPQSHSGLVQSQGAVALPRARLRDQMGAGGMAGDWVSR